MMPQKEDVARILRENGYRATSQRLAIYEALRIADSHPTVAEVHESVVEDHPTISLATVYKTLQIFTKVGLAREMALKEESTRYDLRKKSHINLICNKCGKIQDFFCENLRDINDAIEADTDFKVTGGSFEVYGICGGCQNTDY
ncbi:MAG: transcriptional repressor [Candidatus Thorarchaeota archaeon]|nr:transcriptional repressor [Candidatus Thorarchaeota archaeon]